MPWSTVSKLRQERAAAGKSDEAGRIQMQLQRVRRSEVVVEIADDGAGMNIAAIRSKGAGAGHAASAATATCPTTTSLQLVLEPGFSTASTVTQQAGRGVGMDVVATEIKKLGGALHMESTPGAGHALHDPPAVHARDQPRTGRAGRGRAVRAAAADGGGRRAPVSRRSRCAPGGRTCRASNTTARAIGFQQLGVFVGLAPSELPATGRHGCRGAGARRRSFDRSRRR